MICTDAHVARPFVLSILLACAGTSFSVAAAQQPSTIGSEGLGDELFPKLGNGGYDALDYEVTLTVDMTAGSIDASSVMKAKATQDLSRFNLDFTGLEVKSVQVDGADAKYAREGSELEVTPAAQLANGKEFEARVAYSGVPTPLPDPTLPIKLGWQFQNGEVYIVNEPYGASSYMPVNDHPRDKATYTFRVTVPKPFVVAGNGSLVEKKEKGDQITYVWRSRDPVASYVVTLAIAKFDVETSKGPKDLPILNYFAPATTPKQREGFAKTADILSFLSDKFGPYPFESAGGILASIPIPGALETQTRPTYGAREGYEIVLAHELAHQWYGNSVSFETWRDIWLAEGFAEYASWLWVEHTKGAEAFQAQVLRAYGGVAGSSIEAPGKVNADQLFGGGVYVRGPLVLHALRLEVGDETFFKILKTWHDTHKNGVATDDQFVAHASEVAKKDLKPLLDAWLYDATAPKIASLEEALAAKKAEREKRKKKD